MARSRWPIAAAPRARMLLLFVLALLADLPVQAQSAPGFRDFEFVVSPGMAPLRFRLHADDERIATHFEVFRPGESVAVQTLPTRPGEPPGGGALPGLRAEDLDGDGYLDLLLVAWWGATGNVGYLAWRFDPKRQQFVEIPEFEQLSQPRVEPGARCIRTRSNGGHAGAIYVLERWCWRAAVLEKVWEESQQPAGEGTYLRVSRELRDGRWVETARRRLGIEDFESEPSPAPGRSR